MAPSPRPEAGFTLIEALVALAIIAMVVISFLGIRTKALIDAMHARNWRLAREIAEEKMSTLQAGAHETPPESNFEISLADKYEDGWSYKIVIGEGAVAEVETELTEAAAGDDERMQQRAEWQQGRERYEKANRLGLNATEYEDKLYEDEQRRLEEAVPTEDEFEEVAVVVYFPKLNGEYEGDRDSLMIRDRISTLAISGLTPEQAEIVAESRGESTSSSGGGGSAGALPGGNR